MKQTGKTNHKNEQSAKSRSRSYLLWLVLFFACYWSASFAGQSTTVFNIPPNDTEAFLEAIHEANKSGGQHVIRLAENSEYAFDLINNPPEDISVALTIEGHNSHLLGTGVEQGFGQLFTVKGDAFLTLTNLVIREFHRSQDSPDTSKAGLISVYGSLLVNDVQIDQISVINPAEVNGAVFANAGNTLLKNVRISNVTSTSKAVVMWNEGTAELENVLIIDSARLSPAGETLTGWYIFNFYTGELDIRFSTFIASSDLIVPEQPQHLIFHDSGGFTIDSKSTVTASILIDVGCSEVSNGYNLVNDPSCKSPFIQQAETDMVGVSPGPLLIETKEGYVMISQIGSPALDGVSDEALECPATDAIGVKRPQDGTGNGIARCDIGAFEMQSPAPLFAGGENGLFYNRIQDGHYLTIQEVRPNQYFIFWATFNLRGEQAWVYALGSADGNQIEAQAYYNPTGTLVPGSGPDVDMSAMEDWGIITISLKDCLSGEFEYDSNLTEFGSGSFLLDRLAFIQGLGCKSN